MRAGVLLCLVLGCWVLGAAVRAACWVLGAGVHLRGGVTGRERCSFGVGEWCKYRRRAFAEAMAFLMA